MLILFARLRPVEILFTRLRLFEFLLLQLRLFEFLLLRLHLFALLLLREQAVLCDHCVAPDLVQSRQVDRDLGLCRLDGSRPIRLYDRLHIRRDPLFALFGAQVAARLQISPQLSVRFMQERMDPVSVKIQIVVPALRPLPVFILIFPAFIDGIDRLFPVLYIQIDRIGKRMPRELPELSETGRKDVPSVTNVICCHIAPYLSEEMFPPPGILFDHRGLLCFAAAQSAQRTEDLFIRCTVLILQGH